MIQIHPIVFVVGISSPSRTSNCNSICTHHQNDKSTIQRRRRSIFTFARFFLVNIIIIVTMIRLSVMTHLPYSRGHKQVRLAVQQSSSKEFLIHQQQRRFTLFVSSFRTGDLPLHLTVNLHPLTDARRHHDRSKQSVITMMYNRMNHDRCHHHHHHHQNLHRHQHQYRHHSAIRRRMNRIRDIPSQSTTKTTTAALSIACRNLSSLPLSSRNTDASVDVKSDLDMDENTPSSLLSPPQLSVTSKQPQKKVRTIYTIDYCPPTDPNKLQQIVTKHIDTFPLYQKNRPIAYHTQIAFTILQQQFQMQNLFDNDDSAASIPNRSIVLDSGCGTGRSTIRLGQQYPNCIVLGIDRSIIRLTKNRHVTKQYIPLPNYQLVHNQNRQNFELWKQSQQQTTKTISSTTSKYDDEDNNDTKNTIISDDDDSNNTDMDDPTRLVEQVSDNVWMIRAELVDMWRLLIQHEWHTKIVQHYLYYPNPYPKCTRLQQRWYAHPSFPLLKELLLPSSSSLSSVVSDTDVTDRNMDCKRMIVRSNWKQYLDEFAMSTKLLFNVPSHCETIETNDNSSTTYSITIQEPYEMTIPYTISEMKQIAMTNFEEKYWLVNEATYEFILSVK